jgi:hypothetical protein
MIRSFLLFCCLLLSIAASAQSTKNYRVAVAFRSICCGVPSNEPLLDYVRDFKANEKVKKMIHYDHIGPLGKEGEYSMGFDLKELCRRDRKKFIAGLKIIVPTLKDKGTASVEENYMLDAASLGRATISSKQL